MPTKLFVGNLAWEVTSDDLRSFFTQYGTVVDAIVLKDKMTGKSRGFGFVEMETDEMAKAALAANGQELKGRNINVNEAKPMTPR